MIQKDLLLLEEKNEEVYPYSFWQRLKKYFGDNSTGVRNWLLIVGLLTFAILLLLGPAAAAALPAAALLGLLITAAVIASISVLATLIALINSIKADYIEYKRLHPEDNYFLSLISRFKEWILNHKFEVFLVILCFIPLFAGIPTLIGAPALAIFASIAATLAGAVMIDGAWRLIEYLYDCIPSTTSTRRDFSWQSMVKAESFDGHLVSVVIDTGFTDSVSFNTTNKDVIKSFFNQTGFSHFFNTITLGNTNHLNITKNKTTNCIESFEYFDSKQFIQFERKENHQVNTETLKYSVYHDQDLGEKQLLLHVIIDVKTNHVEFIVNKMGFKIGENSSSQTNVTVEEPSSDSEDENNVNISSKLNYQSRGLNPAKNL